MRLTTRGRHLALTVALAVAAAIGAAIPADWTCPQVGTYGTPGVTLNGGVTFGDCGIEVWGEPGPFCGND